MDIISWILYIIILIYVIGSSIVFWKSWVRTYFQSQNKSDTNSSYTYHIIIDIDADNDEMYASNRRMVTNIIAKICRSMNVQARASTVLLWDSSEEVNTVFSEDISVDLYCSSEHEFYDIYHRILSQCERYTSYINYGEGLR